MVYKFSRIQCVSCVATRLRKMFPILGLLACCVVSPAVAGETTPADVSDQPASVQMINNSIERQMRAFEAALENSRHTDAQTTRLDELIRLQKLQEKVLEKISDDLRILVQLQIGKLQQDARSSSTKTQGH